MNVSVFCSYISSLIASGTFVDRQVRLLLAQDVVLLLLLHVGALVVILVQDELVGTCSTGEGIPPFRILVGSRRSCNGQAVAAIWADCLQVNAMP